MAAAPAYTVAGMPAARPNEIDAEVGVLTYIQEAAAGAASLLQAAPVVGDVCATLLAFGQLVDTARSNKEELAVLRELCDVVVKGFLKRSSELREDAAQGFQSLQQHVDKAKAVAKLCNGVGMRKGVKKFILAGKIRKDIAAVRKNVHDFSVANNLVLTRALLEKLDDLAAVDKLATVLTDKEKELKVTQHDLEAQKGKAMRLTKELKDRDEERLARDRDSLDLKMALHNRSGDLEAMKAGIEDQRRLEDLASRVKFPSGAPRIRDWYVERGSVVAQACQHLDIASSLDSPDGCPSRTPRVVGLTGSGGAGKSTVASMVIARKEVRASYHKGVLWLPVGRGAKDRLPSLTFDLAGMVYETVLSKSCRPPRKDVEIEEDEVAYTKEDGVAYITEMAAEGLERVLVVADDVWEVEVLQELLKVGACILYTTRQGNLFPDAPLVRVGKMVVEEAEMVLRRAADLDETAVLPVAAYELMERCEFVALDIAFVGRWGVVRGRRKDEAWQTALDRIMEAQQEGGLEAPLPWRAAVLRAGLGELADDKPQNKELYLALAVIPKGFAFSTEVAAALLYDDTPCAENLKVAEKAATTLERWSILTLEDGGHYRVHNQHNEFMQGCLLANKDVRDRVLPRWRRYISSVRALLTYPDDALVAIWDKLACDEGGVVAPRPYDGGLDAMDISSAELPEALEVAAGFHWLRQDWQGAYTAYTKLKEITDMSASTLCALSHCATQLGRWEEAEELLRDARAIFSEMAVDGDDETKSHCENRPGVFVSVGRWFRRPRYAAFSDEADSDRDEDHVLVLERKEKDRGTDTCDHLICMCFGFSDDVLDDTVGGRETNKGSSWCVGDSAMERVFIPDASRNTYVVVGLGGATVRMSARLDSPVSRTLPRGTRVVVDQIRSRRAHLVKPMDGWASLTTETGYTILESVGRPTKYKVVHREGIFVRSSSSIDEGRIVRIAPFGTILKATGKTEIFDAVERVEVEGGWVSMRLREDMGAGAPLLMPLS